MRYLLRAADTESTELCGSSNAAASCAASTAVVSSTPRTAWIGWVWAYSTTASAERSGSLKFSESHSNSGTIDEDNGSL